jgi:hypothetical protein
VRFPIDRKSVWDTRRTRVQSTTVPLSHQGIIWWYSENTVTGCPKVHEGDRSRMPKYRNRNSNGQSICTTSVMGSEPCSGLSTWLASCTRRNEEFLSLISPIQLVGEMGTCTLSLDKPSLALSRKYTNTIEELPHTKSRPLCRLWMAPLTQCTS